MSIFDSRAAQWDNKSRRVKLARDVVEAIIKYANPAKGIDIADFGTGTGLIMLGLADYAKTMTGYDSSQGMLDVLADKAKDAGLANLKTALLDIDKDDFPAESADLMTCSMVAHHLDNPQIFFEKAYAGIRKGGKLCVADLVQPRQPFHEKDAEGVKHEGFLTEQVEQSLLSRGFANVVTYPAAIVEKERDGNKLYFPIFLSIAEK